MNISLTPPIPLIAGILILVVPRLLTYIVFIGTEKELPLFPGLRETPF